MKPTEVVKKFLGALEAGDLFAAEAMLDENVAYENVGMPVDHGKESTMKTLRRFMMVADKFEVIMKGIAENGDVVLTERIDILSGPGLKLEFWVCGRFEVKGEKITLWKDYFDWATLSGQIAKSVPGFLTTGILNAFKRS